MSGPLYAGIDLGGTKILVVITDEQGKVLAEDRVLTHAAEGPDAVIARVADAVRGAASGAAVEIDALAAGGVSAPGPIDAASGVITQPPNLPGWHDVPLARLLHEQLDAPFVLENDANCGCVGEHLFGAGKGLDDMLFVTVSTGIGGGIIIDNKLYVGASGAAGEVGHMVVSRTGPKCGAGHVGCLEAFASGTAIAARAEEAIAQGRLPRTARLAEHNPPLTAETVYLAAQQGEAEASDIIQAAGHYLGLGLASMVNAFNPQAIVLGGGLTNMGDALLRPAMDTARERSFAQSFADVRIIEGELGERAAALGAVAVARQRHAGGAEAAAGATRVVSGGR
ncbi:MAG TPA: ROK family protein [Dehalococcoidia bacterium]|nr:ROK family protein [Dehalococcoidia bacterium]